jgi:RNA polymerase sigma factor (sigma-70 family)
MRGAGFRLDLGPFFSEADSTMADDLQTRASFLSRLTRTDCDREWVIFYQRYGPVILSFCRRRGLDDAAARDVLQETTMLLLRKLPKFEYQPARGRFRNWLLTLVAGKIADTERRQHRAAFVPFELAHEDEVCPSVFTARREDSASASLDRTWQIGLIEEALRQIRRDPRVKPETLEAFLEYVVHEKPAAVVAAAFSLEENALYQIKARLVRRIRQLVEELESPAAKAEAAIDG